MADDKKPSQRHAELVPDPAGNVRVEVIMGPYRGQHLTMPTADGQSAIDAHWARHPNEQYGDHDPLTDQQRTDALTAAHTWAQAQWDVAQGTATHKDEKRAMKPDEGAGYSTRQMETPKHPEPPRR